VSTTTPPSGVVRDLASDWILTACHEMGHALGALAFEVPLERVWLRHHRDPDRNSEWCVLGRTEFVPDGDDGLLLVDDNEAAPVILAGLEAEVRWLVQRDGGNPARHRDHVWGRQRHRDGDVAALELHLSDVCYPRSRCVERVNELLDRFWAPLVDASAVLAQRGELDGQQVRQLLGDMGNWRLR
jgi:hypothetical protein